VKTASSGVKGILVAQSFGPNIILLDIGLPDMDGYQVAQKLRELSNLQGVPIVAMSVYRMGLDNPGRNKAEFDHFLLKPPQLNELRTLILECLS
jgi:CheY-like chemotaxis protein